MLDGVLQTVRFHSQEMMAYYDEQHELRKVRKYLKWNLENMPAAPDI
jgi:tRNA-dihydrouridine synthase